MLVYAHLGGDGAGQLGDQRLVACCVGVTGLDDGRYQVDGVDEGVA